MLYLQKRRGLLFCNEINQTANAIILPLQGHVENTSCHTTVIPPKNLSAQASGLYHIALRWFKPLPEDYNFDLHYSEVVSGAKPVKGQGPTAFGPIYGYQTYDLKERTQYDFFVKHVCKHDLTQTSTEAKATAKTLDKCKHLHIVGDYV